MHPHLTIAAGVAAILLAMPMRAASETHKCSRLAAVSMSAVEDMTLLNFMKTVARKAGMEVVDHGIGHMKITGDAFSGMALNDLLRETSKDRLFTADIKGCNVVLSPVLPANDDVQAQAIAIRPKPTAQRSDIELANLVLAIAEKSGRSVTMIGKPVPFLANIDGALDMDAQNLASAINKAAIGVMRVMVNEKSIILRYLSSGLSASMATQDQFREQGQFLVLPTQ